MARWLKFGDISGRVWKPSAFMKVILMRTLSKGEIQSLHLVLSGKAFSGRTGLHSVELLAKVIIP